MYVFILSRLICLFIHLLFIFVSIFSRRWATKFLETSNFNGKKKSFSTMLWTSRKFLLISPRQVTEEVIFMFIFFWPLDRLFFWSLKCWSVPWTWTQLNLLWQNYHDLLLGVCFALWFCVWLRNYFARIKTLACALSIHYHYLAVG